MPNSLPTKMVRSSQRRRHVSVCSLSLYWRYMFGRKLIITKTLGDFPHNTGVL